MTSYHTHAFNTAQEFWNAIKPEEIHNTLSLDASKNLIYRGQADSNWLLSPNVARNKKDINITEQLHSELRLILYFLDYCDNAGIQVPGHVYNLRQDIKEIQAGTHKDTYRWPSIKFHEVLAFAQHYGVPTRLLDWTKRSFISAYFSSSEVLKLIASKLEQGQSIDLNKELAIWVLDRDGVDHLNNTTYQDNSSEPTYPFQIINVPSSTNTHIAAQQGCFSIFRLISDDSSDLGFPECLQTPKFACNRTIDNSNLEYLSHLYKLTLPYSEAHTILNLCEMYNVNAASIFPTATGAGFAVRDRTNYEVVKSFISGSD